MRKDPKPEEKGTVQRPGMAGTRVRCGMESMVGRAKDCDCVLVMMGSDVMSKSRVTDAVCRVSSIDVLADSVVLELVVDAKMERVVCGTEVM